MYNDAIAARLPAKLSAPASTRRLFQASPHLYRCYLDGLTATKNRPSCDPGTWPNDAPATLQQRWQFQPN